MYVLYYNRFNYFRNTTLLVVGEYNRGISIGHHYIIILSSDLEKLLVFDDTGFCTELIIFDLPSNYKASNSDYILIILDNNIV